MAALIVRVRHRRLVVREAARVGQIPNGPDHLPGPASGGGARTAVRRRGVLSHDTYAVRRARERGCEPSCVCVCSSRLGMTCHREEVVVVHRCGNVRVIPGPAHVWACTAAGGLARPPSGISLSLEKSMEPAWQRTGRSHPRRCRTAPGPRRRARK